MKYLDLFVKPLGIAAILAGALAAQDVTRETLVNPSADSWPMPTSVDGPVPSL